MARYKGKREAAKPGKAIAPAENELREEKLLQEDTAAAEQSAPHMPDMETKAPIVKAPETFPVEAAPGPVEEESDPFSDPFGEEDSGRKKKQKFFQTRGGKAVLLVLCAVLAFAMGGAIAVGGWIREAVKPPEVELPSVNDTQQQTPQQDSTKLPETPEKPDEEEYPDDGYDGDMPTVSGNRKEGVYTFLLVGTDKGDGNTDTIMVVSYDTVNQNISIMSIPRDTMINESWDIKKINSVYSRTGGSIDALANRVRKLIGFKPDFYVKVDLSMFVQLVDLVGGVDFYVPQNMNYSDPYQDLYINLKEGQQTLDGDKAMQLVRFRRYAEGDIQRVRVQQDFMKALIKECLSFTNWGKVKAYIQLGLDNVQTDLEFGSVVWFAANVLGLNEAPMLNMDNVYTCTIPGNYYASAWSRDTGSYQSYVTIYASQTVKLVNERFNPYVQNVTSGMLDVMTIKSNGDISSNMGLKDTKHNAIMAQRRGETSSNNSGTTTKEPENTDQSPAVQTDPFGNYFIVDTEGNIIYTDAKGTPLGNTDAPADPNTPPSTPNTPSTPDTPSTPVTPEAPTDPNAGQTETPGTTDPQAPAVTPDPGATEPVPETPPESAPPSTTPSEGESGESGDDTDSEKPDWLG